MYKKRKQKKKRVEEKKKNDDDDDDDDARKETKNCFLKFQEAYEIFVSEACNYRRVTTASRTKVNLRRSRIRRVISRQGRGAHESKPHTKKEKIEVLLRVERQFYLDLRVYARRTARVRTVVLRNPLCASAARAADGRALRAEPCGLCGISSRIVACRATVHRRVLRSVSMRQTEVSIDVK